MKRLILVLALVGFCSHVADAQSGHYFLSHYKPGSDKINYLSFDIHQDQSGILYFANSAGVLQFDGRTWVQVPANGSIYTLTATAGGSLYAGGSAGFGKIALNEDNQLVYASLSDSLKGVRNIFASHAMDRQVFFLNEEQLFVINDSTRAPVMIPSKSSEGTFTGLYPIGNQLYVDTEKEGLKMLDNGTLQATDIFPKSHLVFSEPSPDGKSWFVATEGNKFFVQRNGQSFVDFRPRDVQYLVANVVVNCAWVNDQIVAIGTLRGGVVFVDLETSETLEIVNYNTGLPDNEVFAVHTDNHAGVWIAHEYGFSRVAPFLPFRTYRHYPGLVGNLLCVQTFGTDVYVGTSQGLYRLSKDELFIDELYEVRQTISNAPDPVAEGIKPERKKSRRGFLGLGKKKIEDAPPPVKRALAAKHYKQVQKVRRVLQGVEHSYKRVTGVEGKVDQLIVVGNKLLGGGVSGAFEVQGSTALQLTAVPSRSIYYSENLDQLLVSTYYDQIQAFRPSKKGWEYTPFLDTLSIHADYMFEDHAQNLWICGRNRVVVVGIEGGEILDAKFVPLPYTSIDKTVGLSYGQDVYVTQNGEFFHYLSFKNKFVKYDSLPGPKKFFASSGSFWFYDGHRWTTIDRKVQGEIKTEWLALFPDIRFLAPAEKGKSLWVITATNELYKFSSDLKALPSQNNPLFLKEVRNQQSRLSTKSLMVDEGESALTFEFIQPDYISLQAVEYHYWIKGLQADWSDWSTQNNIISVPFFPPGRYSVYMESRDLFGNVTKLDTVDISVVPPYWRRPAFYALEFIFFAVLVILSIRLKSSRIQYRYVSQFLTALTIVLLIQFIQTVVVSNLRYESTPVADFFIQVMIALVVLPAENFLRKRMITASEKAKR